MRRDMASAFYLVEIEADPARLSVEIAGEGVPEIIHVFEFRDDLR